jgi:hypothetical protein
MLKDNGEKVAKFIPFKKSQYVLTKSFYATVKRLQQDFEGR